MNTADYMRQRSRLTRVGVGPALMLSACLAGAQTWGTYQGNIQHSGYVPIEVSTANIAQMWQVQLPTTVQLSQAACGNGMVFVTSQTLNSTLSLFGVDASTGTLDWTQGWMNLFTISPPALYDGNVYVQTDDNSENALLNCFAANGDFVWRQPMQQEFGTFLTPTLDNGVAYVSGGDYSGMYAYGAFDGAHDWYCSLLAAYVPWTPSLDANYAYAYFAGNSGYGYENGLYAINRITGNADYEVYDANSQYSNNIGTAPAISGSMCYVANTNRLVAFDLKHRLLAWQTSRQCNGQPDVVGNVVYVADGAGLSAFDATTGSYQWSWQPPSGIVTGPFVITNNVAFVGTAPGTYQAVTTTYGVDLTTRQQVWSSSIAGALSLADGNLYIGGANGQLTAFSLGALQLVEPTGFQFLRGMAVSGNLASIQSVDDQVLKAIGGPTLNTQEAPIQIVITGTSPSLSPAKLGFHLEASVSTPNVAQTIELWNFSTSRWDLLGTSASTRTESGFDVSAADPSAYIQSATGEVRARVSWKAVGPTLTYLWSSAIDQAGWLEG